MIITWLGNNMESYISANFMSLKIAREILDSVRHTCKKSYFQNLSAISGYFWGEAECEIFAQTASNAQRDMGVTDCVSTLSADIEIKEQPRDDLVMSTPILIYSMHHLGDGLILFEFEGPKEAEGAVGKRADL